MNEPIQDALEITGILLEFAAFEIFGIPGFHFNALRTGEQVVSTVEDQIVSFQISTADVVENAILEDLTFQITDAVYIYTFKVAQPPTHDFTGWSLLEVYFQSKVEA